MTSDKEDGKVRSPLIDPWPTKRRTGAHGKPDTAMPPVALLLALLMCLWLVLSITKQSLWMDEAATAWFAAHPNLSSLAKTVSNRMNRTSDPQMPFHIFYVWFWARLFGTGEWALRCSNIPFAVVLVTSLVWTSWRVFHRPILWTLFCFSPFIVYYMNEARPYIPLLACATASTGALLGYFADRDKYGRAGPWFCLSTFAFAFGIHMLAAFLAMALVIFAVLSIREKHVPGNVVFRDWALPLLAYSPLLIMLAAYYLWTISAGAGGMKGRPGIGNIAFSLYELMGFLGLGPPRHELRAHPSLQTLAPYWPSLAVGIIGWMAAFGACAICLLNRERKRMFWSLLAAFVVASVLFIMSSFLVDFRFWGRHLTALVPLLVFATLELTGETSAEQRSRVVKGAGLLCLALAWVISDARLLLSRRYYKDDYREAARIALDETVRSGGTLLWAADLFGARYYGLEYGGYQLGTTWPIHGQCIFAANWTDAQVAQYLALQTRKAEVILALSKGDLYDHEGAWTAAVSAMNARKIASLNSFDIYIFDRKHGEP